jgi:beta-fructofuranosidase
VVKVRPSNKGQVIMKRSLSTLILIGITCGLISQHIHAEEKSKAEMAVLITGAQELRAVLHADPYRPKYHFVPPEAFWNDINGTLFWKGRYHVFYLARVADEDFMEGTHSQLHKWGHSSSIDLVHWIHHPPAMLPDASMPRGMYSGDAIQGADVPTLIYHVPGQGTCISQAEDDMLIKWTPLAKNPVIPIEGAPEEVSVFDVGAWKEGDTYYALVGNKNSTEGYEGDSSSYYKSKDLKTWDYIGPFYKSDRKWTPEISDAACIDFYPLGDKHMVLTHVHSPYMHTQYYLGTYIPGKIFIPEQHGKLSGITYQCMAPETMLDDKGRTIMMAWNMSFTSEFKHGWQSLSTLPRVFSLSGKGTLEQRPVEELKKLRHNHRTVAPVTLRPGEEVRLDTISGTCMEIGLTVKSGEYDTIGVKVFQAADGSEETIIGYDQADKKLFIDFGMSAQGGVTMKTYEQWYNYMQMKRNPATNFLVSSQDLPFELAEGEDLNLQIFVDQSVVEVFANDRQVLVQNVYPTDMQSTGVSLFTEGADAQVTRTEAWDMHWTNAF